MALPNDPSSVPSISGGTQLSVPAAPWNPVPSSGIYDHLHIHGIHTHKQHATFEDEEEKEEEAAAVTQLK